MASYRCSLLRQVVDFDERVIHQGAVLEIAFVGDVPQHLENVDGRVDLIHVRLLPSPSPPLAAAMAKSTQGEPASSSSAQWSQTAAANGRSVLPSTPPTAGGVLFNRRRCGRA